LRISLTVAAARARARAKTGMTRQTVAATSAARAGVQNGGSMTWAEKVHRVARGVNVKRVKDGSQVVKPRLRWAVNTRGVNVQRVKRAVNVKPVTRGVNAQPVKDASLTKRSTVVGWRHRQAVCTGTSGTLPGLTLPCLDPPAPLAA
jgi:hypothetical protein